jgi:hypothetical protein
MSINMTSALINANQEQKERKKAVRLNELTIDPLIPTYQTDDK